MLKANLEHIIRAASAITNEYEIIVVGSQSILASVDQPPLECVISREADIIVANNERLSDLIDGAIGEGSMFEEQFGYYAQGVDFTTSVLPNGWRDRLVRLQSSNTDGKAGLCLDVYDLFVSKCVANREKDRVFNKALLRERIINAEAACERADLLPLFPDVIARLKTHIQRLHNEVFTAADT
jgi:hypothetical protein